MTESDLLVRLKHRYSPPEYAFLPQLRNQTGYSRITRTADAVAMSVWPSRGITLHGFEIKCRRNDWANEKKKPEKAEEIGRFCDYWWLVVADSTIVQPGELPAAWGLLVANGKGLKCAKEPVIRPTEPVSREFLAAVLRKAQECVVPKAEIDAELKAAHDRGVESEKRANRYQFESMTRELTEARKAIDDFQNASGIRLSSYTSGRIGEVVRLLERDGIESLAHRLEELQTEADNIAEAIRRARTIAKPASAALESP